jgi:uncharacterized membrane protein
MRLLDPNHAVAVLSYLALLILQAVWHALLPEPLGARAWWLGVMAALPLLLPLRGILEGRLRSMTWGGYLLMLYFSIGVMEAWSNPPQRVPALVQTGLVIVCFAAIFRFSRQNS